jgi:hypothetical protein
VCNWAFILNAKPQRREGAGEKTKEILRDFCAPNATFAENLDTRLMLDNVAPVPHASKGNN